MEQYNITVYNNEEFKIFLKIYKYLLFTSFPIGETVMLRNESCLVKNKWLKVF